MKKNKYQQSIIYIAVFLIISFCTFPFLQILSTSLKHQVEWGNPNLIPKILHLDAYQELLNIGPKSDAEIPKTIQKILENPNISENKKQEIRGQFTSNANIFPFVRYMLNTFSISLVTAAIATLLAIMAGYSLARLKFTGRRAISNSVLLVYMVGGILLMVPLYQISVTLGLASTITGTILSLLLIYLTQTLPVAIYMLGNYFRTIPFALEEAAMVDGYTRFETIWKVMLPLSRPMIFTIFIYCFIIAWNEYLFASVFLKQYTDYHTLPLALKTLFMSKNAIWDRIMAASILTLIPVLVCFLIANKRLTGGMTDAGVKE